MSGYERAAMKAKREAEQRVRAAAPELLAALEELRDWALDCGIDAGDPETLDRVNAAIAKARDEDEPR